MMSNFWNTDLDDNVVLEKPKRVAIKHDIPTEATHELAVDIYETDEKLYIVAPMAGVKVSDLEIAVNENNLTVKGNRKNPFAEHSDTLYSSECFWGNFERKLSLPSSVDTRDMSASYRNGILLIEAPRIAPSGLRRISVS